ncbi:MAG: aldo/keto reductase [Clostridia bacterium]|nr:aldo/keto reductase [Clostridia bacterium]
MIYREVPKNNDKLSSLGYGLMRLPMENGKIDDQRAKEQLFFAIDNGVNYIDTAWTYHDGDSEAFVGRVLTKAYRQKVKIVSKLPQWLCKSKKEMHYYMDKQLEKMKIQYIDYYLIHSIDGPRWEELKEIGVLEFLDEIKEQGKAINVGFSYHGNQKDFSGMVDDYDWDMCQIQYNILDEEYQAGTKGLKYAASKGMAVMIMEPLRGGMLANNVPNEVRRIYDTGKTQRSNAEWALKWLLNQPEVTVVLSGMNEKEHIIENLKIASETNTNSLTQEDLEIVKKAGETYRSLMKIGCTSCGYCMPCPKNVDIPNAFHLYNAYHMNDDKKRIKMLFMAQMSGAVSSQSLPSQCINCGKCTKHCPQNIEIPKQLEQVKKIFEFPFMPVVVKVWKFMNRRKK